MKRYIVLFAIFITAIFFYPVFAHADKIGEYFSANPASASAAFLAVGAGLLSFAGLTRRVIRK